MGGKRSEKFGGKFGEKFGENELKVIVLLKQNSKKRKKMQY